MYPIGSCSIEIDNRSIWFKYIYRWCYFIFQCWIVFEKWNRESTDTCSRNRRDINQCSHQKPTWLDKYPRYQGLGDNLFDIQSFLAHKSFDDRVEYKSRQCKIGKIFHNISDLSEVDIHMDKRSIDKIIGHEFTCEDSENNPSSWTQRKKFL